LVVTGLGRAGTTFLHELLAQDPANRVPMLWETMYSVPAPETVTYETDPRIAQAHLEASLMDEIVPAVVTMQEIGGDLPTECIYLFAHQFASDMWIGTYNIPSYMRWMVGSDPAPAYAYHRRMLELLQWRHRLDRWVVHGHTVVDTPRLEGRRLDIDTGAFQSGRLTAVRIAGKHGKLIFS